MHHRRFHFQKTPFVQPVTDRPDDPRTLHEHLARLGVDDQIDVALAVTLFDIGHAMKLVRQGAQRLGQQAQRGRGNRQFAGLGAGQPAFHGDDVANIPGLEGVVGGAERIGLEIQLDSPGLVLQLYEAGLAHHPLGHDAASQLHNTIQCLQRVRRPLLGIGKLGL